jgi:hypothetical protein
MSLSRCSIVVTWRASARTRLATAAIVSLLAIALAPVLASTAAPRQSSRARRAASRVVSRSQNFPFYSDRTPSGVHGEHRSKLATLSARRKLALSWAKHKQRIDLL